ncbi:Protein-glutamine gamma-glutamyltransferase [Novipirellula aureliae]|uniref:Protein-glutamine gamma-glutamyltransferase n=1 Tax=Novipirellula aureliae TaxID=2527966 RepID=A0A5C6E7Z7_9BACT|nr:transglutaminase domain-containing protein [Novipirellula aureliae]TWU43811.1 Protein-glutamine gamma-glutamyltransferase [Novipirellula aureliae]
MNPLHLNHARIIGLVLIALQVVALGFFFKTPLFCGGMLAAIGFAAFSKKRFASPQSAKRWPIIFVVLFVVSRTLLPTSLYAGRQSFLVPDACLIAMHFVVYQTALFFVRSKRDRPPNHLPILAITAMIFTGDIQVQTSERLFFQLLSILLVVLSIGYFLACRNSSPTTGNPIGGSTFTKQRWWLLAGVAIACSAIAWASASNLYRYAREIEDTMNRFIHPSLKPESVGFSGQGRLGSVASQKGESGKNVALRVDAEKIPGYLRGKVFDTYLPGQWQCVATSKPLKPAEQDELPADTAADRRDGQRFAITKNLTKLGDALEIWPNQNFQSVLFTPLDTSVVQAHVDHMSLNLHHVVSADEMPIMSSYKVWTSPVEPITVNASGGLSKEEQQCLTMLPSDLDPRISMLAEKMFSEANTTTEKIAVVENYFLDNYEYQIGIEIPHQVDPINYFLLERPAGHCEYFASGAVVLLRAAGIPCRYVTGFVAAEKNDYGDYWIARNRDAHAWAEAYDEQLGWVLVEATPAEGVPQETSAQTSNQIWDAAKAKWQKLVRQLRRDGLGFLIQTIGNLIVHPLTWILLLVVAIGFTVRRYLQYLTRKTTKHVDPLTRQLHVLLDRMDQSWKQKGLERRPSETLHQFARRLELAEKSEPYRDAANWYRRFAVVRYGGKVTVSSIESLQDGCV